MSTKTATEQDDPVTGIPGKGSILNGSIESMLTPDLLYKMNKKIAQLTKVVYGLNTRGEELEAQLLASREAEEKCRALNVDLQLRVNAFKSKIENEMGKLRDLETQANQAQIWKLECENLQRRLDVESSSSTGEARLALNLAREELEQSRRRETSLHIDLDQARHAITNLKAHHEFIMRERDAQQAMEREKIALECQNRLAEMEGRFKLQMRRLTEDKEVLTAECDVLRERAVREPSESGEEDLLRDEILALQIELGEERKNWQTKYQQQSDKHEEEIYKINDDKLELLRKLNAMNLEKENYDGDLEDKLRSIKEQYEGRIQELISNQHMLQSLIDDKEDEFEVRLKTKVVEWKSEWDMAEGGLKQEINKLKDENLKLQKNIPSRSPSMDKTCIDNANRMQSLEEELADLKSEMELKSKNFKVRVGMVENENRHIRQERDELEKRLEEDKGRFHQKLRTQETMSEKAKIDLLNRLQQMKDCEKILKEAKDVVDEENEILRTEKDDLLRKFKEKEREWEQKLENDVKTAESKIKQKLERVWLEKLKKAEENHAFEIEKIEDERRRKETSLKRELNEAQKTAEETKLLNEEFRNNMRMLRHSEADKVKMLEDIEKELKDLKMVHVSALNKQKELSAQELKYQHQIDQLAMKLSEKQSEVADLVEELKEVSEKRNFCSENLEARIEELKIELRDKEAAVERMKLELQYAKNETDLSKTKMRRLEDELGKTREVTSSLQEQNSNRAKDTIRLKDMELKLKSAEEGLRKSESVRKDLQQNLADIEAERDEEMKIVQDALDEAAQEREELIATFEKELQLLNKTNTAREQQMMEDFEWKLREMEKEHKKKLEEKQKQGEESLNAVRSVVESELAESLTRVAEDRRMADEKLSEVGHLRSYEAEVIQLRGVTHEFQKALRASAREMENLRIRERLLDEEIRSLKTGSQSRQNTLQRVKRHTDDEEVRQKVEKMKNELNAEWEDKLRSECSRLKAELDELHSEEKHLAVESMKVQKEQDIQALKKSWELRNEEMAKEISTLKDSLTEKDAYYHKEQDTQRTNADRDIWDLRMKLQKMNEACFDQKQQMEEKHRDEMERCRVDYEDRIGELERRLAAWDAQAGVDLVADMEKEHRKQMQHIEEQHRLSMERLREENESERFQTVEEARIIITKHHEYIEASLREQLAESVANNSKTIEEMESLRKSLARRDETIRSLKEEINRYQETKNDYSKNNYSPPCSYVPPNQTGNNIQAGLSCSQYSLASSNDSFGSGNSQGRYSLPETTGVYMDGQEDNQKASSEQKGILEDESEEEEDEDEEEEEEDEEEEHV